MNLPEDILNAIREHAAKEFDVIDAYGKPRESCGVVIVRKGKHRYVACRNIAERNEHFVIHPTDLADAEDEGEVILVVHSHPNIPPTPSVADLIGCESSALPWLIISWPTNVIYHFQPTGFKAPLYGRQFAHGIMDCYTFIRDYYMQELGITLLDFAREDEWWLKGKNLYLEGFQKAGFTSVSHDAKKHDVVLMQVGSQIPNHGAVVLGDGCIGHHQMGRLSSKDVLGGWYQKIITHTLRHESQM